MALDHTPTTSGNTVIASRAVAAIARKAAGEVDGVELVTSSGLGRVLTSLLGGGSDQGGAAAKVGRGSTAVALHLSLRWPEPVAQVTEAARCHVRDRVSDLTGYTVTAVDIVVDALPAPGAGRRRVL